MALHPPLPPRVPIPDDLQRSQVEAPSTCQPHILPGGVLPSPQIPLLYQRCSLSSALSPPSLASCTPDGFAIVLLAPSFLSPPRRPPPRKKRRACTRTQRTMANKKRRSVQSIFATVVQRASTPDSLVSPTSPTFSWRSRTRSRTNSAATTVELAYPSPRYDSISSLPDLPLLELPGPPRNSPPPDLLDDDPFANLSPAPSLRASRLPPLDLSQIDTLRMAAPPARSPLAQDASTGAETARSLTGPPSSILFPRSNDGRPPLTRPKSFVHGQSAFTRLAFRPRPSLPSLNTLAQSHVVVPKVPRGRVGAQLPAEPWAEPSSPRGFSRSPNKYRRRHVRRPTLSMIRDSRVIMDSQFSCEDASSSYPETISLASISSESLTADDPSASSSTLFLPTSPPPPSPSGTVSQTSLPSLCHSSPGSSSSEHMLTIDVPFPPLLSPPPRYSDVFEQDLLASLDYNYADALSSLSKTPSPNGSIVLRESYYAHAHPGTSAETIRGVARPSSDDAHSHWSDAPPLSPPSSSAHSRSSSSDYGDALFSPGRARALSDASVRSSSAYAFPPWPPFNPREPVSFFDDDMFDDDVTAKMCRFSRRSSSSSIGSRYSIRSVEWVGELEGESVWDEAVDAGEGGSRRQDTNGNGRHYGGNSGGYSNGRSNGNGYSNGHGHGNGAGGSSGFGGSASGNGGDDGRYPRSAPAMQSSSEEDEDDEEEEDESSDDFVTALDFGGDELSRRPSRSMTPSRNRPLSRTRPPPLPREDDVPLAQQIPSALKAQRTIRRQVRDEIDQRRQERNSKHGHETPQRAEPTQPSPRMPPSPNVIAVPVPRSPEPPAYPARSANRPRTRTLPGNVTSPIAVGELTRKLMSLQASSILPAALSRKRPSVDLHPKALGTLAPMELPQDTSISSSHSHNRTIDSDRSPQRQPSRIATESSSEDTRGRSNVRPSRSLHRSATPAADSRAAQPTGSATAGRSRSVGRTRVPMPDAIPAVPPLPPSSPRDEPSGIDRARSVRAPSRRSSPDRHHGERDHSRVRKPSSVEQSPAPPPPPLPASFVPGHAAASSFSQPPPYQAKASATWQQRIFIGNMQTFCLVEIGSATTAGDIMQVVDAQGALHGGNTGGWMVWEMSQDFGMERPVRSFELLSQVCGSWNNDKTVNFLVIKKTVWAHMLSRSAVPSSSPVCSGYVQHEYKRGKWQKRWLELREHSLWLCKRDTGKDQTFLCSLNNFDAYIFTRPRKAPKQYVFAIKSTDSLSFFENTADYVHIFSCGETEGRNWVEKILVARSYVLYQERNVLSSTGVSLARVATRPGQRPTQPLVNVAQKAEYTGSPLDFEPRSLLGRRKP